MSDPSHDSPIPRSVLLGAAALIGFALVAVVASRVSGYGTVESPLAAPLESRDLRFEDRADGAITVHEPSGGRIVEVLEPGTSGFVRGVLRGMARERRSRDLDSGPPFRITRWSDGRLTIEDLTTGTEIDLHAFGPTNTAAFARFLEQGGDAR